MSESLVMVERVWLPPLKPRAVVVLVHGFGEHIGRYSQWAENLNALGIAVYGYDQRGFGQSQGIPAYIDRFSDYTDDLKVYLASVLQREDVPLFLFGHSMGGAVAARYVQVFQPELAGLILSAPYLKDRSIPAAAGSLVAALAAVLPRQPTIRISPKAVSRDPRVVEKYRSDPLVFHGRIPARTGSEMLRAGQAALREAYQINLPLLILQGQADRLADPKGAATLFARAQHPDKTLKIYPGLYHEVFFEPEGPEVFSDLKEWLEAHI